MRVLVVDDEAEVRTVVCAMLAGAGYEVTEAGTGAGALRALRQAPADVVVCDMYMPNMDGFELIRSFHQEFPDLKVIAMSGGWADGAIDVLQIAQRLGIAGILYKPFKRTELLAAIDRVLRLG